MSWKDRKDAANVNIDCRAFAGRRVGLGSGFNCLSVPRYKERDAFTAFQGALEGTAAWSARLDQRLALRRVLVDVLVAFYLEEGGTP